MNQLLKYGSLVEGFHNEQAMSKQIELLQKGLTIG